MSIHEVNFETQQPIPYHMVDMLIGLDVSINLDCKGTFSYEGPEQPAAELTADVLSALEPTLMLMSEMGLAYRGLPHYNSDTLAFVRQRLEEPWAERGIEIVSLAITEVEPDAKGEAAIKAVYEQASNPADAAAALSPMNFIDEIKRATPRPQQQEQWVCPACGCANTTKFCGECGSPRP